ncbi:hypothetical protein [Kingella potus]|uniref:hypothetical protein n=1 Tax=Kingella potus TaxID=265175 RepID=UPI0011C06738|nr:hypothetical protein [Kingella potus]
MFHCKKTNFIGVFALPAAEKVWDLSNTIGFVFLFSCCYSGCLFVLRMKAAVAGFVAFPHLRGLSDAERKVQGGISFADRWIGFSDGLLRHRTRASPSGDTPYAGGRGGLEGCFSDGLFAGCCFSHLCILPSIYNSVSHPNYRVLSVIRSSR